VVTLAAKPPAVQGKKKENNRRAGGQYLLCEYFSIFPNGALRQYRRRFPLPEIAV
jgi:hypothetical protein